MTPNESTSTPDEITNSIGMKLRRIPPGTFEMGSPDSDATAPADEKPRHPVTISRSLYLGAYPVTQSEYKQVTGENPSHFPDDRSPVERVSWVDAVRFCDALSRAEGLTPFYNIGARVEVGDWGASGYRLLTEAEWEYACRAGSPTRYCFGDDPQELDEYAWYTGTSNLRTRPVGQKKPNRFGLHDMHGNVWEWCWDGYDAESYKASVPLDPRGKEGAPARVIRGGGWESLPGFCGSATRFSDLPESRRTYLGFRLARVQSGAELGQGTKSA